MQQVMQRHAILWVRQRSILRGAVRLVQGAAAPRLPNPKVEHVAPFEWMSLEDDFVPSETIVQPGGWKDVSSMLARPPPLPPPPLPLPPPPPPPPPPPKGWPS
mmetsp:Transcript_41232/g.101736  ORF Transcript_41232/g.101736 Transcript_41232/m.101736 type:complete len:103 (+) Transcript_41232:49-357(+)